jgi:hypothetical protein
MVPEVGWGFIRKTFLHVFIIIGKKSVKISEDPLSQES